MDRLLHRTDLHGKVRQGRLQESVNPGNSRCRVIADDASAKGDAFAGDEHAGQPWPAPTNLLLIMTGLSFPPEGGWVLIERPARGLKIKNLQTPSNGE